MSEMQILLLNSHKFQSRLELKSNAKNPYGLKPRRKESSVGERRGPVFCSLADSSFFGEEVGNQLWGQRLTIGTTLTLWRAVCVCRLRQGWPQQCLSKFKKTKEEKKQLKTCLVCSIFITGFEETTMTSPQRPTVQ